MTCQQRTLTPQDSCSWPTLGLTCVLTLKPDHKRFYYIMKYLWRGLSTANILLASVLLIRESCRTVCVSLSRVAYVILEYCHIWSGTLHWSDIINSKARQKPQPQKSIIQRLLVDLSDVGVTTFINIFCLTGLQPQPHHTPHISCSQKDTHLEFRNFILVFLKFFFMLFISTSGPDWDELTF